MSISVGFLMYAALYRLTVLAVGALSIWLGFRLFNNRPTTADSAGSASAEGGGFKLALTNVLPGTYFALFGTVIIGIMLWQGPPQLSQKNLTETTDNGQLKSADSLVRYNESNLGGKPDINQEWDKLGTEVTLAEAAVPLSNIAKIWQQENRIGEAVAMARLAAEFSTQDRAKHRALFAELLLATGDKQKALKVMQAAVEDDPTYRSKLDAMQKRTDATNN